MMNAMSKRSFSSLYNYAAGSTSKVSLTVTQGGNKVGDMVFALYDDKQPATCENFKAIDFSGANITQGMSGMGINICGANGSDSAFGLRLPDEDMSVRHVSRG